MSRWSCCWRHSARESEFVGRSCVLPHLTERTRRCLKATLGLAAHLPLTPSTASANLPPCPPRGPPDVEVLEGASSPLDPRAVGKLGLCLTDTCSSANLKKLPPRGPQAMKTSAHWTHSFRLWLCRSVKRASSSLSEFHYVGILFSKTQVTLPGQRGQWLSLSL